jgi:hypothetical protein
LELPDAVRIATQELGDRFQVVPVRLPVLDLASRADVSSVARALRETSVHL